MNQSTASIEIEAPRPEWLETLRVMNNAAVPAVNALDAPAFARLAGLSPWMRVATRAGRPVGFLLGLTERLDHDSRNYGWFNARYAAFAYIDRVVIAPAAARLGAGRRLYGAYRRWADAQGKPMLVCEVNLRPRNDASLAFHAHLGFRPVGRGTPHDKEVQYLRLDLAAGDG